MEERTLLPMTIGNAVLNLGKGLTVTFA